MSTTESDNDRKGDKSDEKKEKDTKNYFEQEYARLKARLNKIRENIEKMKQERVKQEFTPDIYNSLEPYSDISTVNRVLNAPQQNVRVSSVSRVTAIGLCEPWEALLMDNTVLPKGEPITYTSLDSSREVGKKKGKSEKEGSTHLPRFPRVQVDVTKYNNKRLDYSDVPMLRKELRETYTAEAKGKIDEDYKRTMQDFTRMELDVCLDELEPSSRDNVRDAMIAYLQNTPGSSKALRECLKKAEERRKEKEKENEKEEKEENKDEEDRGEDSKSKEPETEPENETEAEATETGEED